MRAPVVIKVGGGTLDHLDIFWDQLKLIKPSPIIIHGGGIQSSILANRLGHTPRIIRGRRVTGDLDLSIAEWTMRGAINVRLVAEANARELRAAGLSGVDGSILNVRRREPWLIDDEMVDFGWVGEIVSIDTTLIETISNAGFIPIIAPLGVDASGQRYNVNADTVAGALAIATQAKELLLVTDTGGVLQDPADPESLLRTCSPADEAAGIEQGWITGGMLVKLRIAREALASGVPSVWILGADDLLQRQNATSVLLD
ncbi:MAG: acetylglutamate kinase [Rhodothermaceae bacterium]|nr:acetylglutamate kinase [Rhodothermaceae bacterium]MYF64132.1 acetylglutamate kinase [Rhodothermaceae bacterium]MYI84857.1 acetylglutamate kinase [Rhodothermaceae bacterium]